MIDKLFEELAGIGQVEAIALGGSRAGERYDESSDYDVYVYTLGNIDTEIRKSILGKYCSYMEIDNHFWEQEDNCRLSNGTDIDIIYRSLDDLCKGISDVAEGFNAGNGYTTCMWHNLLNCKMIYDKNGRLAAAKERFSVPYPDKLRDNIIKRNMDLIYDANPAYSHQIEKAASRGDRVSIIHRTAAFLESYFDIIFALNKMTHSGEKRLMEICISSCKILPEDFEADLNRLFDDMSGNAGRLGEDIEMIASKLKKVCKPG